MIVSIVICTYNRAHYLQEVLNSLVVQTSEKKNYEVIVVNNNSTDQTQEFTEKFVLENENFKVVFEIKQGLSHARNRGYMEAQSNWVAYLDDDAKVYNNYIERLLYVIENYKFDCFGGVYIPWYKFGKPKWFKDSYGSNGLKIKKTGTLESDYVSGGVIVFKKSILEHYGGFDIGIGMVGSKVAYGEETLLQHNMRRDGFAIGFDPELIVEHLVAEYKLSSFWFLKSAYAGGRDSWRAFNKKLTMNIVVRSVGYNFLNFGKKLIYCTPKLLNTDYYIQNWIIDVFEPLAYSVGSLSDLIYRVKRG